MGVGQGENGEERESQFAELAEATAVSDPVATVVMRSFAPPAVTDDRIAQTYGTLADELFRPCRHPVKCVVAMICRKWDNENRYCLEALPLSGTWLGICAQREPSSSLQQRLLN